jgi:hypothetical protein
MLVAREDHPRLTRLRSDKASVHTEDFPICASHSPKRIRRVGGSGVENTRLIAAQGGNELYGWLEFLDANATEVIGGIRLSQIGCIRLFRNSDATKDALTTYGRRTLRQENDARDRAALMLAMPA